MKRRPIAPRWMPAALSMLLLSACMAMAQTTQTSQTLQPSPSLQPADAGRPLVVVDAGRLRVSVIDGQRFVVVHQFGLRGELLGSPQFSADRRHAYFATAEGWITRFDLQALAVAGEVQAGAGLKGTTLSSDGRWLLAAMGPPHALLMFSADLTLQRRYAAATLDGKRSSPVAAVYDAAPRRSFVATLPGISQLWEISYDPTAEPIHDGLVHDYRMGESIASPGHLGVRRTPLDEPLCELSFDASHRHAIGATCPPSDGPVSVHVINLDVRRRIASLPMQGPVSFHRGGTAPGR